jgi:hypothetical protein
MRREAYIPSPHLRIFSAGESCDILDTPQQDNIDDSPETTAIAGQSALGELNDRRHKQQRLPALCHVACRSHKTKAVQQRYGMTGL